MVIVLFEPILQHDPQPHRGGEAKGPFRQSSTAPGGYVEEGAEALVFGASVRIDRNESLCHKASHRLKRIARPLPDPRINVSLLFSYPKLRC